MRVVNERGLILAMVRVADSPFKRLRGLLRTPKPAVGEGLWIEPCNSVHMFFMPYPLKVVYVNRHGVVLRVVTLQPWTFGPLVLRARAVLEVAPETEGFAVGDRLALSE